MSWSCIRTFAQRSWTESAARALGHAGAAEQISVDVQVDLGDDVLPRRPASVAEPGPRVHANDELRRPLLRRDARLGVRVLAVIVPAASSDRVPGADGCPRVEQRGGAPERPAPAAPEAAAAERHRCGAWLRGYARDRQA